MLRPLHAGAAAPTADVAHALPVHRVRTRAAGSTALRTWHPRTRPDELTLDPSSRWTRLDIVSTRSGGPFDSAGQVAFRAWWRTDDDRGTLEETSDSCGSRGGIYVDGVVA